VNLTWEQVRARRLARSRLTDRAGSVVDAARDTCGIQAQLQAAAEHGLRLRGEGDVGKALWEERTLVKTWTLRGTLHIHPSDELLLWTRLAPRGEVDGELLDAFRDALDGRTLLREELADAVGARMGGDARAKIASGWAYLIGDAAAAGILVQGPPRGNKVTFVRADQWLGELREWDTREALRRYVRAYGPVRDAKYVGASLDPIRDELAEVHVGGKRAWVLAGDDEFPELEPSRFLLREYDCYVIGFRERDVLVPPDVKEQYWDTRWLKKGRYESPVMFKNVLVDGLIAGKWD
jgi:hypothetical protein